jgi:hypothetical protein
MDRESLKKLLRMQPFKPFRLFVDDGAQYDIRHPDLLMVARDTAVIGIPPRSSPEADLADDFAWVDLSHISRAESLEAPTTG